MSAKSREALQFAVAPLLAAAVALGAVALWSPPPPVPASAPSEDFSAERAFRHVEALANRRPLGSPAHAEARAYLIEQLAALGHQVEVQETEVARRIGDDRFLAARVRNVLTRVAGSDSSGALLLMAHYDSRSNTPGAGDDLSGVAAILETLRALSTGAPLENDLIVLFSDAEELGLLGAQAFVDQHPWAADVRLVVNLEGRGNRGPALMFETREGNFELIEALSEAVAHPSANSMSYEVYRRMPNDTDFSVFRDAGVQGLNVAFIGNHAAYHTLLDAAAALDRGTLQHVGSYALGLARYLGSADLGPYGECEDDAVYFNAYPWRLIVYRASFARTLALAAAALLLAALGLGWKRSGWRLAGIGRGLLLFFLGLLGSAALGWCFWWLFRNYLTRALYGPYGLPYETGPLVLCLALLVSAVLGALASWLGERAETAELCAGGWLGWAVVSLALAWSVTGASFLTAWPLLFGALGAALVAAGLAGGRRWAPLLLALGALPALWLLAPAAWTMAQALTLRSSAVIGLVLSLLLLPVAPHLGRLHRLSRGRSSWLAGGLGLAILVWVVVGAAPTSEQPAVNTLAYAVDPEAREAWWASFDAEADDWTGSWLGPSPERRIAPSAFALGDFEVLLAPAAVEPLAAPVVELIADSRVDGRRVEGLVRSTRDAPVLRVRAEASVPLRSVTVAGETYLFEGDAAGVGEVWISAYGFEERGLRIGFEVDEAWPIELDLVDQSWGFGALSAPPAPRPEEAIPGSSWRTDAVYVQSTALL